MSFLDNSIKKKLAGGFGICVALMAAIVYANYLSLQKLMALHHQTQRRSMDMETATDAQHVGEDMYLVIANAIINRDVAKTRRDWAAIKTNTLERLRNVASASDTRAEQADVRKAQESTEDIVRIFEREVLPHLEKGAAAEGLADLDARIDAQITAIDAALQRVAESMSGENREAEGELHVVLLHSLTSGLTISLAGVLAALGITALSTRRIVRPLSEITRAALEVQQGNYLRELEHRSDDEIGMLADVFRGMSREVGKRTVALEQSNQELYREIGERKLAERELVRAKEAAEAANRAKTDFLASMSHEIRTPMNGVLGMVELALMETTSPKVHEYLELAKQSAKSLLAIINDILDVAKIEAGKVELAREEFDLPHAVAGVCGTLAIAARQKGVCLACRVAPGVPTRLIGDEGRLRQVLANLVGNAVKFTEHGQVEVSIAVARGPEASGTVALSFAVRDTGIGIPAAELGSIFDSFVQVKRSAHAEYGGTGLGLTITKQLVELMGGEIRAQSEHGKGSCFSFTAEFGLVEGNEEAVAAPPAVAPAGCTCSLRILLAEDNPVNRFLAQDLLERQGHSVCVARNGREALEALGREPFDVVLMDLQMPEMSGMEAARRIRKGQVPGVPADFPIVAVTARAFRGDREVYMEAGLDDYVTKPIDPGRLNEVLATIATRCGRGPQSEEPEVSDPTA